MSKKINNIHDKFIKRMMSDKRVAKDFFRQHLPQKIQKHINFNHLKTSKASFIDDHLRLSSADILFETTFQEKPGYLYLLLEHQSTPDALMPFRLLNYMIRIMQQHLEIYQTKVLPIVYPIVFATTKKLYKGPRALFELFGKQKELAKEIFFKPFQLIDVNTIPENALKKHLWAGAMAYTMRHIYDKNVVKALKPWVPQLIAMTEQGGGEVLATLIRYVFEAGEAVKPEGVIHLAKQFPPTVGEKVMTIAEYLRQEGMRRGVVQGMEQGIQQGMEQGIQQGMEQSAQEIAKKLFKEGIPLPTIAKATGLNAIAIKALTSETFN